MKLFAVLLILCVSGATSAADIIDRYTLTIEGDDHRLMVVDSDGKTRPFKWTEVKAILDAHPIYLDDLKGMDSGLKYAKSSSDVERILGLDSSSNFSYFVDPTDTQASSQLTSLRSFVAHFKSVDPNPMASYSGNSANIDQVKLKELIRQKSRCLVGKAASSKSMNNLYDALALTLADNCGLTKVSVKASETTRAWDATKSASGSSTANCQIQIDPNASDSMSSAKVEISGTGGITNKLNLPATHMADKRNSGGGISVKEWAYGLDNSTSGLYGELKRIGINCPDKGSQKFTAPPTAATIDR